MPANNALLLSDINFDDIKGNLQTFLSNQTELGDYDYESSTMQVLLNLLAYNTYMNSYYLNMVGNEMFLDSAQIRSNVISRAKMLGYTPRSSQGSTAVVNIVITPDDAPANITIAENTKFRSTIDGKQYIFVNPEAKVVNANSSGVYSTNLSITEGRPFAFSYTVSSLNPTRYIIPANNVDLTSLKVTVQETAASSSVTTYIKATNLEGITANSTVYFVEEDSEERYELFFGDNVLGKALNDGNVVNISYRVCNGIETLNASTFSNVDTISGYSDINLTTVSNAQGGANKETIQSIKFNAPKSYSAQNRAVTKNDYKTLIKNRFGSIQSVSVWGGEENVPPIYGKTYIALKPFGGEIVATEIKNQIKDYLIARNVMAIDPVLIDPTYVYIVPTIDVKFNPNLTSLNVGALATKVSTNIINYESNEIGLFDRSYINSELSKNIFSSDDSFTSVNIDIKIMRKFVPDTTRNTTYTIDFRLPLLNITGDAILRISPVAHPGRGLTLNTSSFTYDGRSNSYMDDDGFGNVRIYYIDSAGVRVYTNRLAGTIDYSMGKVTLDNLLITGYTGDSIKVYVEPEISDIETIRDDIILISEATINMYDNNLKRITNTVNNVNTQGNTVGIEESGIQTTVY